MRQVCVSDHVLMSDVRCSAALPGPSPRSSDPATSPGAASSFCPSAEGAGFGPGQRAGIRRPGELGRGRAGNRGCRSGWTGRSSRSGTLTGSSGRCRSRNRPGRPGSSLSGQNPKSIHHQLADQQCVTAPGEFNQGLHATGEFGRAPAAFHIVLLILPEFFGKSPQAFWRQTDMGRKNPESQKRDPHPAAVQADVISKRQRQFFFQKIFNGDEFLF